MPKAKAILAGYTNLQILKSPDLYQICEKKELSSEEGKEKIVNGLWEDRVLGDGSSNSNSLGIKVEMPIR